MATGTGNLPNQNMDFVPLAELPASDLDKLVENIESLADGSGIGDGAIDTAKIADGAVTNDKLSTTAGEVGGAWTTWAHNFAGFTGGSETVTAKYTQIGKTVHVRLKAVLGATPSAVTNFTFNLPVTANSDYTEFTAINGSASFKNADGGYYIANCYHVTTTQMIIRRIDQSNLATISPTTTSPFNWESGDSVSVSLTYEAL